MHLAPVVVPPSNVVIVCTIVNICCLIVMSPSVVEPETPEPSSVANVPTSLVCVTC